MDYQPANSANIDVFPHLANRPLRRAATTDPMPDRGKLAVLTMLGLALAAAAFAWWWNVTSKKESLAFYGPAAARLIGKAPTVELIEVEPATSGDTRELVSVHHEKFVVVSRHDVSQAPGLIHARTALLDDASYEWQAPLRLMPPIFLVRFADEKNEAVLALDTTARLLTRCDTGATVRLNEKIAAGWQQFAERHLPTK